MYKSIYFLLVFIVCLLSSQVSCGKTFAQAKFSREYYDSLGQLPVKELFEKGVLYVRQTQRPDSALVCFSVILGKEGKFKENDIDYKIASYLNVGYIYQNYYHDYATAYAYFHNALDMAVQEESFIDIPYAYVGMASILHDGNIKGDFMPSSSELLLNCYPYIVEYGDEYSAIYLSLNLIFVVLESNDPSYARSELRDLLSKNYSQESPDGELLGYFARGYEAYLNHDINSMVDWFEKATEVRSSVNMSEDLSRVFALEVYLNALKIAEQNYKIPVVAMQILEIARKSDLPTYIESSLKTLHQYYKEQGEKELAGDYEYEYLRFTDSIRNASNVDGVREIEFHSRLNEINTEVQSLNTQRKRHIVIIVLISIAVVIAIAFLVYSYHVRRRLKEANRLLYQRVEEMLASSNENPDSIENTSDPGDDPDDPADPSDDAVKGKDVEFSPESDGDGSDDSKDDAEDDAGKDDKAETQSRLLPQRRRQLYEKAVKVIENNQEIYSSDFSIKTLAEILGEPYYELSIAINDSSGSNFKALLTHKRIKEACRRLKDESVTESMTLEAIAEGLGFKSRTYFNSVFKKYTGLTPTQYMKTAREEEKRQKNLAHHE